MYQYNFEHSFGLPSPWAIITVAAALTVILIVLMALWSITISCAKVLGFGHQPNEDDPEWLMYCQELDNNQH